MMIFYNIFKLMPKIQKLKIILTTNPFTIIKLIILKPFILRCKIKLFGHYNSIYYPKNINPNKVVKVKSTFINKELLKKIINNQKPHFNSKDNQFFKKSKLLIYWTNSDRKKTFDSEIINASHRFFWIFSKSNKNVKNYYNDIKTWLKLFDDKQDHIAWHPYNTSERICNWLNFLGFFLKNNDPKIVSSINKQINFLIENLEYPASKIINNHILNNARALYISGSILNRVDVKELGKEIFYNHLKSLISKNGFLIECSVHYQLLVNRWLTEVYILAKLTKDKKLIKFLFPIISSVNKATSSFILSNRKEIHNFPRIGDISPDMPFEWFNPFIKNKKNWQSIWKGKAINFIFKKENSYLDGWIKQYFGDWTIFSYTHPNQAQYPSGHGHDDFSSICLYYKSVPVIIDIGAKSYDMTNVDFNKGRSANDHSSLLINNKSVIEPGIGYKSIWSNRIRKKTKFEIHKNSLTWSGITLECIEWSRIIKNKDNKGIRIIDTISNKKQNILKSSFYLSEHLKFQNKIDNVYVFKFKKHYIHFKFSKSSEINISDTLYFKNYGVETKIKKLTYVSKNYINKAITEIFFQIK